MKTIFMSSAKAALVIFSFLFFTSCSKDESMPDQKLERNKEVVSRLINECLNRKNTAVALELAAPNFIDRDAFPNQPPGPEGLKFHFDALNRLIPDLNVQFTLVAEGNQVVEQWTGTGNQVFEFDFRTAINPPRPISRTAVTIFTLNEEGKITERRTFQN